jgi:hypothetical protein
MLISGKRTYIRIRWDLKRENIEEWESKMPTSSNNSRANVSDNAEFAKEVSDQSF